MTVLREYENNLSQLKDKIKKGNKKRIGSLGYLLEIEKAINKLRNNKEKILNEMAFLTIKDLKYIEKGIIKIRNHINLQNKIEPNTLILIALKEYLKNITIISEEKIGSLFQMNLMKIKKEKRKIIKVLGLTFLNNLYHHSAFNFL